MKIAFIGHKRIPSREGGVEVVVEQLTTRMAAQGNEVVAYSRKGHNVAGIEFDNVSSSGKSFRYRGVRVIPVGTIGIKGLAALSSSFIATLKAIKARPDVIHYHAEGPCVMLRLAHWAGIRTVATIHGLDWQRSKWGRFASLYLKFGERTAARCADEIIVLSSNTKQYFKEVYGRDVHFISNGVEPNERIPVGHVAKLYNLQGDGYILFLGRIVPEKGVRYLIEAFLRLDTEKKLVIAGGPSDSEDYYNEIRSAARNDERIVFTGFVQGRDLGELYSNAYVYVLPSDVEGMPISLLEAMSFGNCCLTSDIPECTEVLDGYGLTFKRGDVDDLRMRLQLLIDDPQRVKSYRSKAASYVIDTYSWDAVVNRTMELYRAPRKAER